MARVSGLTSLHETPSLWHKLSGAATAARWCRSADPPIGSDKAPAYAAALAGGGLPAETRHRAALYLLWCDAARSSFDPARLAWYQDAFRSNPSDERAAFFIAALCYQGVIHDSQVALEAYQAVLRPDWHHSKYWTSFALPQKNLVFTLASLYTTMPAEHTAAEPGAVEIVEAALEQSPETSPERRNYIRCLSQIYREQGRKDDVAESVYRWMFQREQGDVENCRFLALLNEERHANDGPACAIYGRMAAIAEEIGDEAEAGHWLRRLAHAFITQGRMDGGTVATFERAAAYDPADREIAAAWLYALALEYGMVGIGNNAAVGYPEKEETIAKLEEAITLETEFEPIFARRRWEWGVVLRALALAYGRMARTDEMARGIYARAVEFCPEERTIWALHARTLAEAADYSQTAMEVYEKAVHAVNCDDSVFVALGHAYVTCQAWADPERRHNALVLWETLYRQGVYWPELVTALAQAYTGEERVNDIAMSLWEKQVENEPNNGFLRLPLGRELRLRGDLHNSLRYYRDAARLLPKDFEAQFEMGYLLKEQYSDYANAVKHLQKAIKLPEGQAHLDAHFLLGEALLARDRRDEAKVIFQVIIDRINPRHRPTLLHLAKLNLKYEEEGVQIAEALYEQARSLNPEDPETYRKMADLYREKGQAEEEEQALEKYLMLSASTSPDAEKYRQLADLYIRKGDFLRAESALRQVIALGQGDKKLYTLLGEVILQARGGIAA